MPLAIARNQFGSSAINGDRIVNSGTAGICLGGFKKHERSKLTFRIFRGQLRKIQESRIALSRSSHLRWLVNRIYKLISYYVSCGRDSVVSIATRYGLDGPGIEKKKSRWRRSFPHPFWPALGPTQPPIKGLLCVFPEGKAAGAWLWTPTPPSAEIKERV
jgi:hypothetical protein